MKTKGGNCRFSFHIQSYNIPYTKTRIPNTFVCVEKKMPVTLYHKTNKKQTKTLRQGVLNYFQHTIFFKI